MKKILSIWILCLSISAVIMLTVLNFTLPSSWADTGDPIIEGKTATLTGTATGNATKTTATWSKTIGSASDYATWAAMIADMPDMISHAVTVTIKAGTTLTETCDIRNKHGLTPAATIIIQAEKYFPTSGALPTADSATATTLRDAALATAALGNDYFNGCWVFIVDGTGTDNGFVAITDYIDATGDVVVASWPGTQPDNTSRYLIVGALIDGELTRRTIQFTYNTCPVSSKGIGFVNDYQYSSCEYCSYIYLSYCGVYNAVYSGLRVNVVNRCYVYYCGVVKNNTSNHSSHAGITVIATSYQSVCYCGVSDNNQRGLHPVFGSFCEGKDNFGDGNGVWGTYAQDSGQVRLSGTECSGSSGNHSNGAGDGSLAY